MSIFMSKSVFDSYILEFESKYMFVHLGHHKMELNCRYFVITEVKPVSHAVCAWLCNIALLCFELNLPPVHLPAFIAMSLNICLMLSLLNSGFLTGIEDLDFVLVCLYVLITIHLPIILPAFCHRELWSPLNRPGCFTSPWLFPYTRVVFFSVQNALFYSILENYDHP